MDEPLELPSRAGDVGAVDRDLLFVSLDLGFAYRTVGRRAHFPRWIARVTPLRYRADDLRDDFAGALDLYPISGPQVFVPYEVEVVERRQLDGRAADLHRFEHRKRIERAGAADVHLDREELRLGDIGGELAGDCITRLARDEAQFFPEGELIDFHDAAVDREVERCAHPRLECPRPLVYLLERAAAHAMWRDGNSPR